MRWGVGGTDGAGSMHSEDDGIRDYATLSPEQIVLLMGETISEANGVLQLRSTAARLLLNHFHWEKVTLFEKFFDADGDLKKLFLEVEIPQANVSGNTVTVAPVLTGGAPHYECQICMCEAPAESMAGLECGHKFCASCWNMYLSTKVMDEGCQMITCPAVSCGVLVDDQTVIKLLIDPKVRIHYQKQITESFVQCNRLLRWCPSPGCVNAVKVNSSDVRPVRCNCGHLFCFGCGKEYHDPVNCDMLRCWHKKCNDDSETSNWLAANTKECPKCFVPIQKDGGCNHVLCRNQNCRMDFCWVCLGPWEPHGSAWYNCNRFNEEESRKARDAQEKSRATLSRYLFYFNRYYNHMQSLKFESKLPEKVRSWGMDASLGPRSAFSPLELDFLPKAVNALLRCRQTLMYTYVFAFYLRPNNQSRIFEDNQRDLESATEQLSEYLERDASLSIGRSSISINNLCRCSNNIAINMTESADKEKDTLKELKIKVVDKHRYCERRRRALLAHVREGEEKDWWEFTDDLKKT
ncbi:E3 ubiquitin-protein ligase ARIH1-like [Varroa jacobsoni]|nr:E3 ubiquitin-protein ligase ARIH1-like [Varroa jacobsoni]